MESSLVLRENERLDAVNEKITLIQKKDGLTFGTDAFLLAAFLRPVPKGRAVELGAGSGIVSLLCAARERFDRILAVEVQADFAELIQRNAALNGYAACVTACHRDVRELTCSHTEGEVDTVFANPPYMRTDSGKRNEADYKYIARHEVFGGIDDFCSAASRILKTGGRFCCVWRPDRLPELMAAMEKKRLSPKRMTFVHGDPMCEPSMVLAEAVKDGGSGTRVTRPLFLYEDSDTCGKRVLSEDARRIYDTMDFVW
ncbi:MAG: methyltransferase [Clostridia bacterium]|nr:methyltransferase [Clostridia bacterium]